MKMIKKGDIVSRNSYNNDILFFVEKIVYNENRAKIAILKGVTLRIEADSLLDDLKLVDKRDVLEEFDEQKRRTGIVKILSDKKQSRYGKILHLDGDKRYSEKTEFYYRKKNLNYVVKHVAEYKQPQIVRDMLSMYNPDIVVITGHDGMIKHGRNYNDINNYRNSKYFIKTVKEARLWKPSNKDLIIFAGACQSYYEALIYAGANFASSPARILIDFVDPLIVAEEISITDKNRLVTMYDLEQKIRNGRKAISGIGGNGKCL